MNLAVLFNTYTNIFVSYPFREEQIEITTRSTINLGISLRIALKSENLCIHLIKDKNFVDLLIYMS